MAENFDSLTIKITADAEKAVKAVNNLAKALERVNTALGGINTGGLDSASKSTEGLSNAINKIDTKKLNDVSKGISNVSNAGANVTQTADATNNLANSLNNAGQAAENVNKSVGNQGTSGFQNFKNVLQSVGSTAKSAFSSFLGLANSISKLVPHSHKAASGMKKLHHSTKVATLSAKGLVREFTRISKMLKLMVTRMALRAVIKEVGNGFKSLALHSEEFDASMSSMINGSKKLAYSIAAMVSPLINALAPALQYVINLLVKFANIVNQVFSALSGSGTWNKAKDFTGSWADSIEESNKKAKELKKTLT